jgi:hypothetical protein
LALRKNYMWDDGRNAAPSRPFPPERHRNPAISGGVFALLPG